MADLLFSNGELEYHRATSKHVTNPGARWKVKSNSHKQRNFFAESEDGKRYQIYQRQNLNDAKDFSCGLSLLKKGGKPISLVRYNGSSHIHGTIRYQCHIHFATAEALGAGRKADSYAEETTRYSTLEGALACLIKDCGIQELKARHDERDFVRWLLINHFLKRLCARDFARMFAFIGVTMAYLC